MVRALVVDDEQPSREAIRNYLSDFCSDVEVSAVASSVKSAFKAIQKHKPDVVFLDIELPDGNGFDLLNMFDKINFKVIFVTAYSEYAIKAFRVNAVDYLLKPVRIDDLKAAIDRVKKGLASGESEKISGILRGLSENVYPFSTIVISNVKGFEVLRTNEIIMCIGDGYCTNFYLTGDRKTSSSKNLKQFENQLASHNFVRVHHSYLVNLQHVISFSKQGEIFLSENNKAFLGDRFRNQFMEKLNKK